MVSNTCLWLLTVTTLISLSFAVPFQDGYHNIPETVMFKQSNIQYDTKEDDSEYWLTEGTNTLKHKIEEKVKLGVAKNVILFLGDGMSFPTLAATRVLLGQQSQKPGEETVLSFEKFPYAGLSKTYCVNSQVADSACSATAYLNGVKGNIRTIGVTAAVKIRDCDAMNNPNHQTSSIAVWAQAAGKSTGIVTTSRVSHASPAGMYAHIAHRDWEYDGAIADDKQNPEKCMDITKQLVTQTPGKNLKVVLGGGRGTFLTANDTDPEYSKEKGLRTDGKNLVEAWLADKKGDNIKAKYVWNRNDLLDAKDSDFLLGLFEPSHMKYHLQADPKTEPTLEEMTEVAINILSKESKGYFLFVEGAKIDMAHHENQAKMSLDETIEFAKAIQKAQNLTSEDDTLIVVTADHAHTMSISGYPARGTDILTGLQKGNIDGLPYSTLSYANGPGYKQRINGSSSRYDLSRDDRGATTYRFPGLAPLNSETHGGDDVAVFSRGPWAHILTGSFEQNYIPLVMGYAARIGPTGNISMPGSSSPITQYSFFVLLLCILISLFTR